MSLATIQTPAGITFNERKVSAVLLSGTTTISAKNVVKIDNASLIAGDDAAVKVSLVASTGVAAGGMYGVVTKDVTSAKAGIVQLSGIATVLAGGSVADGNPLAVEADGDVVLATDATDGCIGVALEAASSAAEVKIMLVEGPAYVGTDVS